MQHLAPGRILSFECARPCDAMSSLFFTALWLQRGQSTLVQEIQPAKDIDLTCYKTLPTKTVTRLQMVPLFIEWPVARPPECEHPENTFPAFPHSRWRRGGLQPPQVPLH